MDLAHLRQKLSSLLAEESSLMKVVMGREALLKGSIYRTRTKCGNRNCKCAKGDLHIVWRITKSEEGRTRTKSLCKTGDIERYKNLTNNYRQFREARARIVKIQREQVIPEFFSEIDLFFKPESLFQWFRKSIFTCTVIRQPLLSCL